jgi:hypothetical protein
MNVYQYVEGQKYLNPARLKIGERLELDKEEQELIKRYNDIEEAGFRKIYPNRQEFFNELIETILGNIRQELKIMGICVSLFRESDKPSRSINWDSDRTADSLINIIERGCTVKVLFLKRYLNSEECKYYGIGQQGDFYFMRERDEEFEYEFRCGTRLKIISNLSVGRFIRVLVELATRTQSENVERRREILNRLQIREYISLPALSLYIADDDIYVTPYLYRRHCSTVPAFKVGGKQSDLYISYNGHFEAAWKSNETTAAIDERFIQLLVNEPKQTIQLFGKKYREISQREEAEVHKNPAYLENPERYRTEEKAIREVIEARE